LSPFTLIGGNHVFTETQTNTVYSLEQRQLVGQKRPLKLREIWAIRIRLQLARCTRDLALFNLAIDSKLESTVRYLGIEVEDALEMAERTEVWRPKPEATGSGRFWVMSDPFPIVIPNF